MTLEWLRKAASAARQPSPWDVGNEVLYGMCRQHPLHRDDQTVVAKMWIIGRTYAASIERRRRRPTDETIGNDDFYTKVVAETIRNSGIDDWINTARMIRRPARENLPTILDMHWRVMDLFRRISDLEKRSLASKYLHFHVPDVFYIYDKRADDALRKLSPLLGHDLRIDAEVADSKYSRFSERCLALQTLVEEESGYRPTPRQLDNVLLYGPTGNGCTSML